MKDRFIGTAALSALAFAAPAAGAADGSHHITGGTDAWSSSCGKSGQGAMRASQESYTFQQSGGTLNIRGSGGVDWTFRKG